MRATSLTGLAILWAILAVEATEGQDVARKGRDPVAAAKARQDRVKTLDITFKWKQVLARGAKSEAYQLPPPLKMRGVVPEKETTLEAVNRLVLNGDKLRYENNTPIWRIPEGTMAPSRHAVSVYDGTIAKSLYRDGGAPNGWIMRTAGHDDGKAITLLPIMLTFRAMSPAMSAYYLREVKSSG